MSASEIHTQVAIVGGGIAGLWLYVRLRQARIHACLLERQALGAGQSILAQGIIHGGIKYALSGKPSGSMLGIADMPKAWGQALKGQGPIDLRRVHINSDAHFLCHTQGLSNKLKSLVGSQLLHGNSQVLRPKDQPQGLIDNGFEGSVCKIEETVLDVYSLFETLANIYPEGLIEATAEIKKNTDGKLSLLAHHSDGTSTIHAEHVVLCGGEGNANLVEQLPSPPVMQCRALHQAYVVFKQPQETLFAHIVEHGTQPAITITSDTTTQGHRVWYLGGDLAESGVDHAPDVLIVEAQKRLMKYLPKLDLSETHFGSFTVNRAEEAQPNFKRPEHPMLETEGNWTTCWPVKLTFAPAIGEAMLERLTPILSIPNAKLTDNNELNKWPKPLIAEPPWKQVII